MLNFCTLFDSGYLSRGIALYESLNKYCEAFHLYIFALDDKSYSILKMLNLSRVTVISMAEFENKLLLRVKPTRSWTEYCWTCTSSSIDYIFKKYKVKVCTYFDADIYFYASPHILLDELGSNSVIITRHRFTKDVSDIFGKYCVQFVTFKNNKNGRKVLQWWKNKTIDWCYARAEEGKFGDQKYLDNWTTQFKGVHELQHLGGGVAPWNIQQYEISEREGKLFGVEKLSRREFRVVFFHFASLRFYKKDIIQLASRYTLSKKAIHLLYEPYIRHLESIREKIMKIDPTMKNTDPDSPEEPRSLKGWVNWIIRSFKFDLQRMLIRFRTNQFYEKHQILGKTRNNN